MPSIRSAIRRSYSKLSSGWDQDGKSGQPTSRPGSNAEPLTPFVAISKLLDEKEIIAIELENVLYNHEEAYNAASLQVLDQLDGICVVNGWGSPEQLRQAHLKALEASRSPEVLDTPIKRKWDVRHRVYAMIKAYPIDEESKEYSTMKKKLLKNLGRMFAKTFCEYMVLAADALLLLRLLKAKGKKVVLVETSADFLATEVIKKLGIHGYVNNRVGAASKGVQASKGGWKTLNANSGNIIYVGADFQPEPSTPYAAQIKCVWFGNDETQRAWDNGFAWRNGYYYANSLLALWEALGYGVVASDLPQSKVVQTLEVDLSTPDSGGEPIDSLPSPQNEQELDGKKRKRKLSCIVS